MSRDKDAFIAQNEAREASQEVEAAKLKRDKEVAEMTLMRNVLIAMRDYEPCEIVKDDYAYDRLLENMKRAARAGLGEENDPL